MNAWRTTTRGSLELVEVDEPEAGPNEVVVAVEAFSPNRGESFVLEDAEPGFRPGKDIAGRVISPAASGLGPDAGARVVAHLDHSGWCELARVPVERLATLPDAVGAVQAAALPLAGLTALRLIRVTGSLASRRVLLTGASGGVGHYFVELAAAQGAQVTAVAATEQRSRRLIELGACAWVADPADAAGPFDVGLDSVGGDSTATVLSKLTHHGLMVWFGQASRTAPTLDFFDWTGGLSATIRKFAYWDDQIPVGDDLATLVRLTAAGQLHPEIGLSADWHQTPEAVAAMVNRAVRGNVVLTIPSIPQKANATPDIAGIEEPSMNTITEPKQVLQRYLDALVAGDIDTVRDSFAEDATWTVKADLPVAGPWRGRDQIVDEFLAAVMGERFVPGSHVFEFPMMIGEGDTVALEWHVSARNAAGEPYENDYCGIFVIEHGKIAAVREYLDSRYAAQVLFPETV